MGASCRLLDLRLLSQGQQLPLCYSFVLISLYKPVKFKLHCSWFLFFQFPCLIIFCTPRVIGLAFAMGASCRLLDLCLQSQGQQLLLCYSFFMISLCKPKRLHGFLLHMLAFSHLFGLH